MTPMLFAVRLEHGGPWDWSKRLREQDGWVFSSTPVAVRSEAGRTAIDRVRHAVSPRGELDESMATIVLDALGADELEAEAQEAGFGPLRRRNVPPSGDYVGSVVVLPTVRGRHHTHWLHWPDSELAPLSNVLTLAVMSAGGQIDLPARLVPPKKKQEPAATG